MKPNTASKTVLTFVKYLLWTGAAAIVAKVADLVPGWHVPDIYIPLIGAGLKSTATWIATRKAESEPWR